MADIPANIAAKRIPPGEKATFHWHVPDDTKASSTDPEETMQMIERCATEMDKLEAELNGLRAEIKRLGDITSRVANLETVLTTWAHHQMRK